jgi:tetratricopeptide (TPR) repeat protein
MSTPRMTMLVLCLCAVMASFCLAASPQTSSSLQKKSPSSPPNASFEQLSAAAEVAKTQNRDDDAIRLYHQALLLKPDWKEGLWYLGVLVFGKENYTETRDLMRRLVSEEPKAGPAWALLGISEFQTRAYSRSLDHLQRAKEIGVGDRKELAQSVFYYTSLLLNRFEHYDDAMSLLFAMVKSGSSPDTLVDPTGLAALRYPFLPAEIPADRREMFRLAGQAALSVEAQRPEDAEKLLSSLVTSYPNEPGVHFLYGVFLLDVHPDDGIQQLKKELEIAPLNFTAKLRLADEYLKEERFDEALQLAGEVIKVDPTHATGQMIFGEALVAKGDLPKAIVALETSQKLRPDTVRTHWDLLRAYTAAGKTEEAKQEKEEIERLRRPDAQQ